MLKCLESQSRAAPQVGHESSRGPEVQGPIQRKPLAGTKDTVLGSGQVVGLFLMIPQVDESESQWYPHVIYNIHSQIPHVHPFSGIPMIPCPIMSPIFKEFTVASLPKISTFPRHMAPGQAS